MWLVRGALSDNMFKARFERQEKNQTLNIMVKSNLGRESAYAKVLIWATAQCAQEIGRMPLRMEQESIKKDEQTVVFYIGFFNPL